MGNMLKTVPIGDILANSWRDFTLYPIDQEQVNRLASSIDETGFWLGLQARPHPQHRGKYELAAGHHRKAAAELLNFTHLDIDVVDLSDEMMLKIMAVENATQRGHSSAAILDSVASVLKFIACDLFGDGTLGSREFTRKDIGQDEILGHVPAGVLTENEIKLAIATLKDSGRYATIINEAVEKGERAARLRLEEIERRRLQEEQTERERAEQAARKEAAAKAKAEAAAEARKRAEAEQDAKRKAAERAAEKKAADAAEKKAAADRARADLEVKREQERQQAAELKRQREEEAAKAKEAKAAEKARAAEKRVEEDRIAKARAAADKATEKGVTFDDRVAQLFRNDHQLDVFRRKVTDEIPAQYIRVDQQMRVAESIVAEARGLKRELTGTFIKECIDNIVRNGGVLVRKATAEDNKKIAGQRLDEALKTIAGGRRMVWGGVKDAVLEIRAGAPVPETFDVYLNELQASFNGAVAQLREASGIASHTTLIEGDAAPAASMKVIGND